MKKKIFEAVICLSVVLSAVFGLWGYVSQPKQTSTQTVTTSNEHNTKRISIETVDSNERNTDNMKDSLLSNYSSFT